MVYVLENGDSAEIAVIGNDGVVGISLFLGGNRTPGSTVVHGAGQAYRLPSRHLAAEFERRAVVMRLLLRYTQALVTQMTQTAVCNRHHRLEQQLCRWLLLRLERTTADEFLVTHEIISSLLGVRRECVSQEAGKLQTAGLIRYRRGNLQVLHRAGLVCLVCECFGVVSQEYERLLPANDSGHAGKPNPSP